MRKILHKVKSQWVVMGVMGATVVSLGTMDVSKVSADEIDAVTSSGVTEETASLPEIITETSSEVIPYATTEVEDENVESGQTEIRQEGVEDSQTNSHSATHIDDVETNQELVSTELTQAVVEEVVASGIKAATVPVTEISSITVSDLSATVGETIYISASLTNDVDVAWASVVYESPMTGQIETVYLYKNENNGLFEGNITVSNSTELGTWKISEISASDTSNNLVLLSNMTTDLSAANFTITGTSATDATPPVIDVGSVKVSQTTATVGDTLTFSVKITDNVAVSRAEMTYTSPGGQYKSIPLFKNDASGLYEGNMEITDSVQSGTWREAWISAYDTSGNDGNVYTRIAPLDFTVIGTTADATPPVIDVGSVKVSQTTATVGDTLTFSVKITDDVAVSRAEMTYTSPGGQYKSIPLFKNDASGLYEGNMEITDSVQSGIWREAWISAYDTSGNDGNVYTKITSLNFMVQELTVGTTEINETVPFEKEHKDDNTMFTGDTKVLQVGVDGLRLDTYAITYLDGIESKRELIASKIILAPVNQIIAVGTSTEYHQVLSIKFVDYDATISSDTDGINTQPWGTEGFQTLGISKDYVGMMVVVSEEKVTESGVTWARISLGGQEVGWIAKDALSEIPYVQVLSTTDVSYDAIVTRGTDGINTKPWGTRGFETIGTSADYLNTLVEVRQEQLADNGVLWALISKDGQELGWIAKDALAIQTYSQIISKATVDYAATVIRGTDAINTAPWGTKGYQNLGYSSSYVGKTVDVSKEQLTDYGVTWALVSLDGQELGWIAKDALTKNHYFQIVSTTEVSYDAIVTRGTDGINTKPWGTRGFKTTGMSADYLNTLVEVNQEQLADNGVLWALISKDGQELGWIAKDALKVQNYAQIISDTVVDYAAIINRGTDAINTAPWDTKGYHNIGSSADFVGKIVDISKEQVTDYGVTWAFISLDGQELGWIAKDALAVQNFAKIISEMPVEYQATISRATDAINTAPWATRGYQNICFSADYVGMSVDVTKEQVTDYGVTWALISLDGQELGWIAKDALSIRRYAQVVSETTVAYQAAISRGNDAINTAPWDTKGYQNIGSSSDFVGRTVDVIKEQVTDYGVTWALISLDGQELGWIAKDALAFIVSVENVNYAYVTQNDSYSLPNTVLAYMSDNTTTEVDVVWDYYYADTSSVGTSTYYGTVAGYDGTVSLVLDVAKYDPNIYLYTYSAVTINNLSQRLSLSLYNFGDKPVSITKIEVYEQGRYFNSYTAASLINSGISTEVMAGDYWGMSISYKLGLWLDNSYIKYYLESNGNTYEYTDYL